MKLNEHMWPRLALLAAMLACVVALASACGSPPDSVEDPLSQFGNGVNTLLPFPTRAVDATWDPNLPAPTGMATATPSVDSGYSDMQLGDTGDAVNQMQARLKALGYYAGQLDGKYSDATASAVRLFQGQMGVTQTGLASASLQRMLFSSSAPRYSSAADSNPYDTTNDDDDDLYDDFGDYSTPAPTKKPSSGSSSSGSGSSGSGSGSSGDDYSSTSSYRTLSKGDGGSAVSALQRSLKSLGYYTGAIDGDYGSGTVAAVKRFQKTYGQNQTGVATVAMQTKLFSGDAVRYKPPSPTATPKPADGGYVRLASGDYGNDVMALQKRLKKLGYYTGTPDGEYQSGTVAAVKRFQKQVGMDQNGIASVALQKQLFASNAPAYKPGATAAPTPVDDYTTLRPGDTGEAVKALQRRLRALGFFSGEIGGNYLTLTTDAVKRFQKAVNLEQTGIATAALQRRIFSSDAPSMATPKPSAKPTATPAPAYTELKEGDSGKNVEKLQERLYDLGYYTGKVSGGYGKNTTAAVKLFQKAIDAKQTGVASVSMQKVLFSINAPTHKTPVVTPEAEPTYTKLKPGDAGEKVKALQRRLKALGYFDGDIGGNYLDKTTAAVKAFQKAIGAERTGVATVDLQQKLFSDDAPKKGETKTNTNTNTSDGSTTTGYKALKYNDAGDDVYQLQLRLIELGFMADFYLDAQGTYGPETQQAVIDAQTARGFDSDGNADVEFQKFIFSKSALDISRMEFEGG